MKLWIASARHNYKWVKIAKYIDVDILIALHLVITSRHATFIQCWMNVTCLLELLLLFNEAEIIVLIFCLVFSYISWLLRIAAVNCQVCYATTHQWFFLGRNRSIDRKLYQSYQIAYNTVSTPSHAVTQQQAAVTAYLSNEHLLLFAFAWHNMDQRRSIIFFDLYVTRPFTLCWFIVGPTSETMALQQPSVGPTSRFNELLRVAMLIKDTSHWQRNHGYRAKPKGINSSLQK